MPARRSHEELLQLAACANRQYALDRDLPGSLRAGIRARIPEDGIYVPIVDRVEGIALLDRIRVVDAPPADRMDEIYRLRIDEARRLAWAALAGTGQPPDRFIARTATTDDPVEGGSIGLAAFLAFVAEFAGEPIDRCVVATGWFGEDLGEAEKKVEAFLRERPDLGGPGAFLLVAGRAPEDPPVRLVRDGPEACRQVWGHVPWPTAEYEDAGGAHPIRIQFVCRRTGGPTRGAAGNAPTANRAEPAAGPGGWQEVVLSERDLEPHDLDRVHAVVDDALRPHERAEIKVLGPLPLAARLGRLLKNHSCRVAIVHDRDGRRWWWNKNAVQFDDSHPESVPTRPDDVFLALRTDPAKHFASPWQPINIAHGGEVRRDDVRTVIQHLLRQVHPRCRLHLVGTGPVPLFFALGEALFRRRRVVFCHYDIRTETATPWFEMDQ